MSGRTITKTGGDLSVSVTEFSDDVLEEEYERRGLGDTEKDIHDFDDDEIADAFARRFGPKGYITPHQVFEELYASRTPVPKCVADYLFQETGRTLP